MEFSDEILQAIEDIRIYIQKPNYYLNFNVYVKWIRTDNPFFTESELVEASHLSGYKYEACSMQESDITLFCFSGAPLLKEATGTESTVGDFPSEQMRLSKALRHTGMGDLDLALSVYFNESLENMKLPWEIRNFFCTRSSPFITNSWFLKHGLDNLCNELSSMSKFLKNYEF